MCGIAGSLRTGALEADEWVDGALDLLAHRGPDGRGTWHSGPVTHGHVRLAIMDPTPRSDQPFVYNDVVLSYVGELWNYRELREELRSMGYQFKTTGDTEVVAAMIQSGGADAIGLLEGQFGLAWTDHRRTYLARDRLGETPLYVLEEEGSLLGPGSIRWASERRAFGVRASEAVPVPPGCTWELGREPVSYWEAPSSLNGSAAADPELALQLIRRAVVRRLQSDVPVAFLSSGGLDSSLILKMVKDEGVDVEAYCAALDGGESDDVEAAIEACHALGVRLHVVDAPPLDDAGEWLRRAIGAIEISMKTQVEIAHPCLALARQIYADGYRVVLSGEGADELFGGYGNLMRKAGSDESWMDARRESVMKMARGNCVRTNKSFMAHGVEARLPFLDHELVEAVLPLDRQGCPPGKGLLKEVGRRCGLPDWIVDQPKRTFQGAAGVIERTDELFVGAAIARYNGVARALFGGLPRD